MAGLITFLAIVAFCTLIGIGMAWDW